MKRVQMFLAGAFIAVGSLYAQSSDAEWQAGVAKLKETIQTNPAQAAEEAEHLIKGKNKKNVEHNLGYAFFYGITFTVCALTRITNALPLCAIILVLFVYVLFEKRYDII